MNDQELRLQCLQLALGSMPIPGAPQSDYKSESVLQIANAYYRFLFAGAKTYDISSANLDE